MRGLAVGTSSSVARIGGIISPILASLSPISLPMSIMGVSCLIGGIFAVFLPETLGMSFPETLEGVRDLRNNPKVMEASMKFGLN